MNKYQKCVHKIIKDTQIIMVDSGFEEARYIDLRKDWNEFVKRYKGSEKEKFLFALEQKKMCADAVGKIKYHPLHSNDLISDKNRCKSKNTLIF